MDNIYSKVRSLSTPAIIYFILALFLTFGRCLRGVICANRSSKCDIETTVLETIYLVGFICIWTWLINKVYFRGNHKIAWVMLLFFPGAYY